MTLTPDGLREAAYRSEFPGTAFPHVNPKVWLDPGDVRLLADLLAAAEEVNQAMILDTEAAEALRQVLARLAETDERERVGGEPS